QNTKMFFAYLGDKALSYFTIGNGLTVLALVGLMAATGGMGSEAIMARKPIFNILGKITNTLTGVKFTWLTTFFKPAQAAAMAEVSEGRLKRALKQAMNYF
ncbi:hypothetical protein KY306_03485, partial [Candidatus Woesearchaeota archaeon]|nr:hypothetical protein [Candidatus Woesearchaeota archaeon]